MSVQGEGVGGGSLLLYVILTFHLYKHGPAQMEHVGHSTRYSSTENKCQIDY